CGRRSRHCCGGAGFDGASVLQLGHIPDLDALIPASGHEVLAIGRDRDTEDLAAVPEFKSPEPGADVPQDPLSGLLPVPAAGDERLAVGRERDSPDVVFVALEDGSLLAGAGIPDQHIAVPESRGHELAVGGNGDTANLTRTPLARYRGADLAARHVPQFHGA